MFLSFPSYFHQIFSSKILSLLVTRLLEGRKLQNNLQFWCMILEIHGFGALCFKLKALARQSVFASSWKFWKACNKAYNFHVLSFSWIKMDLGEKWPWKWWKTCKNVLEIFSKCKKIFKFWLFVGFFTNFDFLRSWWNILNALMIEKI